MTVVATTPGELFDHQGGSLIAEVLVALGLLSFVLETPYITSPSFLAVLLVAIVELLRLHVVTVPLAVLSWPRRGRARP